MVGAKATHQCNPGSNAGIDAVREGLNGVNRQPSNALKFNRQTSKKVIFYFQRSKRFKVVQISLFQLIFTDVWLLMNLFA